VRHTSLLTMRNVTGRSLQDSQHAVDAPSHTYRGLANCGKARQLGMTLRHEQPVAGLMTKRAEYLRLP